MILKWASLSKNHWNTRYLLLIAYMIGLAIGIHILNLLTLPFIGLIIYFKKYDYSFKGFLLVMLLTLMTFIMIYSGIILGLPDIISKFNSVYIIIVGIVLVVLSILFLHISPFNSSLLPVSKILSVFAIMFIMLISYNKVFIKSSNAISNDYASQLSVIDDTFLYYLSQQDNPKGNYENLDYEYIESLKKERAIILKNQKQNM